MDSSFKPKDEIRFLRVCHHISNVVYLLYRALVLLLCCGTWPRCLFGSLQLLFVISSVFGTSVSKIGNGVALVSCSFCLLWLYMWNSLWCSCPYLCSLHKLRPFVLPKVFLCMVCLQFMPSLVLNCSIAVLIGVYIFVQSRRELLSVRPTYFN